MLEFDQDIRVNTPAPVRSALGVPQQQAARTSCLHHIPGTTCQLPKYALP